jgi:membrane protein DedA with SNARE-associated domain
MTGPIEAYAGLFGLLFLAWAGLPVAAQPALVAAGILAGKGKLDILGVLGVGALASALGGCVGYWLGVHGGRSLLTMRGPLHHHRQRELERGERLIERYGPVAVMFAPTWVAGIFHMGWRRFLPWDVIAALAWTLVTGLGGYFVGPPIAHVLRRASAAILTGVALALVIAAAVYYARHRRRRLETDS